MSLIDYFADITPGKSAAGFSLGQSINDFGIIVSTAIKWNPSEQGTISAISSTPGWLFIDLTLNHSTNSSPGYLYIHGAGAISLHFNSNGILNFIKLCHGYKGLLYGAIKIGDKLSSVTKFFDIEYDSVEELHFPTEKSVVKGVSFQAEEETLENSQDQIITGIVVETA
jgi:hypothetical protein